MRNNCFVDMPTGVQTHSGRVVDPFALDPNDISIFDIAYHLSNLARFTGGANRSRRGDVYTVAQHSVFVSEIIEGPNKLAALLHDAPEYLLNDFAGPIKANSPVGHAYKDLERIIADVVERAAGLDRGALSDPKVKDADNEAVHIEAWHLMNRPAWSEPSAWGKEYVLEPWSHVEAEARFLSRFEELA